MGGRALQKRIALRCQWQIVDPLKGCCSLGIECIDNELEVVNALLRWAIGYDTSCQGKSGDSVSELHDVLCLGIEL